VGLLFLRPRHASTTRALSALIAQRIERGVASGGGISVLFDTPPWQRAKANTSGRAVPDVAYNADTQSGVITVWTQPRTNGTFRTQGFFLFGGTSAGSPQWAAIGAMANQVAGHRLGFLNAAFKKIGMTRRTTSHRSATWSRTTIRSRNSTRRITTSKLTAMRRRQSSMRPPATARRRSTASSAV
jgi:hypothetical protein